MLAVTNTAASMLDGDALLQVTAEDKNTKDYQDIFETLAHFRDNADVEYIYAIRSEGKDRFVFTVDPTIEDPAEFGEAAVVTEALRKAEEGTASVDQRPYKDDWGSFYSAYSPVCDSFGDVAGIVAADYSASWYDTEVRRLADLLMLACAGSSIFYFLLVFAVDRHVKKKLHSVNTEASYLVQDVCELIEGGAQRMGTSGQTPVQAEGMAQEEVVAEGELGELDERIAFMRHRIKTYLAWLEQNDPATERS